MIVIVSSSPREASSLDALVRHCPRPSSTCSSIAQFKSRLRKIPPTLVLTRINLSDGYSDDILALLDKSGLLPSARVIVLAGADCSPQQEARQLSLGADCVLRDPLRPDVLLEYTAKFLRASKLPVARSLPPDDFALAGAMVLSDQLQLQCNGRSTHITPKEVELARLLSESPGKILPYGLLYGELFNRAFAGDSVNLRVLLGKLSSSYRKLGLDLRSAIRVTPKSGYCYLPPPTKRSTNPRSA
jgi:DNA-binding response OmpR family regulator